MSADPAEIPDSGDDYWSLSRRPLHALLFLLPLLAAYELGVARLGLPADQARNGADYWMRRAMQQAGLETEWVLPGAVIVLLLGWQMTARYRWTISPTALWGMLAESLLFGAGLVVLGQLLDLAFRHPSVRNALLSTAPPARDALSQAVSYVGAGIYEELLFRMGLLTLVCGVLRVLMVPRSLAWFAAIMVSSGLFAAAHYAGPGADPWSVQSFAFRALAGLFFSVLYLLRGFGITVGAHAVYDVLVGILLASPGG